MAAGLLVDFVARSVWNDRDSHAGLELPFGGEGKEGALGKSSEFFRDGSTEDGETGPRLSRHISCERRQEVS
jgi:hypothetical protein